MQHQQQTIQHAIHFEGIGLHTGVNVKVILMPMPAGSGIQFQRTDLPNMPTIEALITHVVETERRTILQKNQVEVATVEHLLAALTGLQIDNICIQLDGPEIPNLDGSSQAFVDFLLEAKIVSQEIPRLFFSTKEEFRYDDPETDSYFKIYPSATYSLHCTITYNRWPLENQYATLHTLENFTKDIAPARSFIYLDEIVPLYKQGLLQGGDPTKAIIFSEKKSGTKFAEQLSQLFQLSSKEVSTIITSSQEDLSTKLQHANEPARHKLLDLMGDLTLLGRPLQGEIFAHKPGHGPNARFVSILRKRLLKQEIKGAPMCNLHGPPLFDVEQVSKMLPHRYPFQLIDKVMQIDATSITGVKNVTINEPFFQGHFPGTHIMPGVLQVEALAQTSGILILHNLPDPAKYLTYFLSIDTCKFRRRVVPGDTLLLHCQLLSTIKYSISEKKSVGIAKVKGRVFVGESLACEATLLAQIVKQHET